MAESTTYDGDGRSKRNYHLDLKKCVVESCEGELGELSYYERNNWATFELQCNTCGKRVTVKVEI